MSVSTKDCLVCGGAFPVKPYRAKEAKYCSYECYWGKSSGTESKCCRVCNITQAASQFQKVNRGFESRCKSCKRKEWRNWARRNTTEQRFGFYVSRAKSRGHAFTLTRGDFAALIENNSCFYCGGSARLGLDRIDSARGYTKENVVQCCRRCNVAKNDMPLAEFIGLCVSVAKKHGAA